MTGPLILPGAVTVIGEALIDLVPAADGHGYCALPGGSPYNVAIGLARLGIDTCLMARLADNGFGVLLRERAQREGIDLSAAARAGEPTTLAVVALDQQGRARYEFYAQGTADWQWTPDEMQRLPERTNILHFGSIAALTPPGDRQIRALAAGVRAAGDAIVSYDPNLRPVLLDDRERARTLVRQGIALAHVVKASAEDVDWLHPGTTPDEVAGGWLELGPVLVVITDGPAGAQAFTRAGERLARPGAQINLVDTVGAGDSFTAAMLASLLSRGVHSPAQLAACEPEQLAGVVDDAIRASALTCQRAGADPPTAAEITASRQPT